MTPPRLWVVGDREPYPAPAVRTPSGTVYHPTPNGTWCSAPPPAEQCSGVSWPSLLATYTTLIEEVPPE